MLKREESKRCEFFAADFLIIFASICTGNQQTNLSFGTKRSILSLRQKKGKEIKSRLYYLEIQKQNDRMMRNKRNVFTWRKPRTIVRARQTFLFMVKRAIYDVPTKWKGKQRNRD